MSSPALSPPHQPAAVLRPRAQETHARIEAAALALFRERGFDDVTVEDVCRAAGVGPATFYRHFGTKHEVVFAYRASFTAALREAVRAADPDAPRRAQLEGVLRAFAGFLQDNHEVLALRDAIVLDHPGLIARTAAVQREWESTLGRELAHRRGRPEPVDADHLDAALGLLLIRTAVRRWRADGACTDLPGCLDGALVDAQQALAPPAAGR